MRKSFLRPALVLALVLSGSWPGQAGALNYTPPVSVTYLYAGNTSIYLKNLARTRDNISIACPDYFEVDASGSLQLTRAVDPVFVSTAQGWGIQVVPFVSNHWNRSYGRAALANRAALSDALTAQVVTHNLDGIDIDIENITEADRASFTDFIRLLRQKLPTDKYLSVCVAANPHNWTTGWQGAYDYAALAGYVDHIFIMTYDESYAGGPAGPVSSYSFVEKSVQYALQHTTPDKILMGIPFYGRYWTADGSATGLAFTLSDIRALTARHSSVLWYDAGLQTARATMTVSSDGNAALWGGKIVSAGVYDIWYENDDSYRAKLSLVDKYGLKGAGSWALGQEYEDVWTGYRTWIHALPYHDIAGLWAEGHIAALYKEGIMTGSRPGYFEPQRAMTRAEAIVVLNRLLDIEPVAGAPFDDIAGHWARGHIAAAAQAGIAQGNDGRFRPNDPVSRQEFCLLIDRALWLPNTVDYNQSLFRDVSPVLTPWSNNAIVSLAVHGILDGYADGCFYPAKEITRAEAAKMIRCAGAYPLRPPVSARGRTLIAPQEPIIEPR